MKKTSLAMAVSIGCAIGPAHAQPPSSLYSVAWEETFSGSSVDTSRWNFRTDVKRLSSQVAANAVISNGQLSLLMKQQSDRGMAYTGAGIVSKQAFGYGYYEVVARTSSNQGWHNSFWMMFGDGSSTFAAGRHLEIDSFEIDTQSPSTISVGTIRWDGQPGTTPLGSDRCPQPSPTFNSSAAFHTYGANWYEGAIDFYIDNVKHCTTPYSATQYRQDPVNIWLTAIAYLAPVTVGGSPQLFDNVRYYKRNQYVQNGQFGYSESGAGWQDSSLQGFGLIPQRYNCTAGTSSRYAPFFRQAGNYNVYIWKTASSNADSAATVAITTGGATTRRTVDFRTGSSGWIDLGQFNFAAGESGSVQNIVGSGCQRAGAVKFIRV